VLTASLDHTVRVWNASTGAPLTSPPPLEYERLVGAEFSHDRARLLTLSNDWTVRVWDAATGKPVTPRLEHQRRVHTAALSPDGTRVVTASADGTVFVWDATTTPIDMGSLEDWRRRIRCAPFTLVDGVPSTTVDRVQCALDAARADNKIETR
jgi:WD40 repeat protein